MWEVYCSSSSSKTILSYPICIFFPFPWVSQNLDPSILVSLRTDFLCGHLHIITSGSWTAADLTPLLHDTEDGRKKLCPISHSGSLKKIIKKINFSSLFLCGGDYRGKKCSCPNLMDLFFKYNQNVCFTKSDILGGRMNQNIDWPRLQSHFGASTLTCIESLTSQQVIWLALWFVFHNLVNGSCVLKYLLLTGTEWTSSD